MIFNLNLLQAADMDDASSKNSVSGFAFYLAEHHYLDNQLALNSLQEANQEKVSYIEYLSRKKLMESTLIAKATSEYYGLPLCDIKALNSELIPAEYLNLQLVRKRQVLPLFIKANVFFVFSDFLRLLFLPVFLREILHKFDQRFHAFSRKGIINRSANAADRAVSF